LKTGSSHVGFVVDKVELGAGFLRVLRFPLPIFIPTISPQSPSPIIRGWYNRPVVAAVTKVPPHKLKVKRFPCSRPWRPIGLREVKAPTLLRQTANRWRQGCQPDAAAANYPQVSSFFKNSWYSFLLEAESTPRP
jgi:hypothetical protein